TWRGARPCEGIGSGRPRQGESRQRPENLDRINSDGHFLAQIAHVILFGSYLRPEVDRLGDVDVAVELRPKEADRGRLRELNYQRAAELERNGHRFRPTLDRESWWQMET